MLARIRKYMAVVNQICRFEPAMTGGAGLKLSGKQDRHLL